MLTPQRYPTTRDVQRWIVQPTDETLDLRGPPLAVPHFVSLNSKCRPDIRPESPVALHPQHASHRRGTSHSAKQHKEGRDQQEGQGVAIDTIEESFSDDSICRRKNTRHQRESRHYIWTRLQLHNVIHPTSTQTVHWRAVLQCNLRDAILHVAQHRAQKPECSRCPMDNFYAVLRP